MFFYATSTKFCFPLSLCKLSEHKVYLKQAAKWAEEKWGYLRGYPGVEEREKMVAKLQNDFYMVTYDKQPIGMFVLLNTSKDGKSVNELMYFYVDKSFRGLGIGSKMLEMAKKASMAQGINTLIFDTLNPLLNKFYETRGATIIRESKLLGHPTTELKMDCKSKPSCRM